MPTSDPGVSEQNLFARRGPRFDAIELQAWRERVGSAQQAARQYVSSPHGSQYEVAPPLARDRRLSNLSAGSHPSTPSRRPSLFRASISQQMADAPQPSPLVGVGLDPARTDYFEQASATRKSLRPILYLSGVITGRVLIAMGLGGVSIGFVPVQPTGPGLTHNSPPPGTFGAGSAVALSLSIAAIVAGVVFALTGLGLFVLDTYALNPRRAALMGPIGFLGIAGVTAGGITYIYGQDRDSLAIRAASLLPRSLGNFGVLYALPNSFAASEIVHGNAPIPNREQTRQISFAVGVALLILYGYISAPGINAPQIARECMLSAGIAGACIGASMARTNNLRLASERRQLRSPVSERRHSSIVRAIPVRQV